MKVRSVRFSLLLVALAGSWGVVSAAPPGGEGFRFELRMDKEAYQKAIAAYDPARIDPEKVAQAKYPAYSTLIESVTAGGQAERAGLVKGWRITALNGREIWERHQRLLPADDGRREIRAVSPEGVVKTFNFEPGVIGTSTINAPLPEVWVLNQIPRGAWDGDMMVATVAWSTGNHELAETALRVAVNRGLRPNPVLDYFASLIALDRGDHEQARALNAAFMKKLPDGAAIPHFYAGGLRSLAGCLGDFALMKRAAQEADGLERTLLQPDVVEQWQAWRAGGVRAPLLPQVQTLAGPDLLSQCQTAQVKWQASQLVMDFEPARDGTYVKELPPKRFDRLSFAPPGGVRDLVWTIRFGYRKTAPTEASCSLGMHLIDWQGKSDWARTARYLPFDKAVVSFNIVRAAGPVNNVELSAGPCGEQYAGECDLPEMSVEEFASFKSLVEGNSPESKKVTRHVNELSLIRLGAEAEIVLNGKSLLHVPVDAKVEDLFCTLQNEGMSVVVDGMTVKALGK